MTHQTTQNHAPGGTARWAAIVVLGSIAAWGTYTSITGRVPALSARTPALTTGKVSPSEEVQSSASPVVVLSEQSLAAVDALIDINVATVDQLQLLPGIGPARALAIVTDRKTQGSFGSLDDLMRIKGIGPATVRKIRPLAQAGGN